MLHTDSAGYLAILGAGDAVMAGQGLTTGAIGASTRGRREGFFGSHTWIPDFLSGHYLHYLHHSLASGQTTGREHMHWCLIKLYPGQRALSI